MAREDSETSGEASGNGGAFNRQQFLDQIKSEAIKKKREALKGKVSGLVAKRDEAIRAVAVIDKEINEELEKFEQGL